MLFYLFNILCSFEQTQVYYCTQALCFFYFMFICFVSLKKQYFTQTVILQLKQQLELETC